MDAASSGITGEMTPVEKWRTEAQAQDTKIDGAIALDIFEFKEASNNDKNADGKVTKSVKDKVKEYIGSLSIPAEQKNALY